MDFIIEAALEDQRIREQRAFDVAYHSADMYRPYLRASESSTDFANRLEVVRAPLEAVCGAHFDAVCDSIRKQCDFEDGDEEWTPEEGDAYITDKPWGGYSVSFDEKFLGEYDDYDEAVAAIKDAMEKSGFFSNVWFVDDHGGMDLRTI